jgi:hypothetical protein
MRRTVSALIKFTPPETGRVFDIVRWYDRG